MRYLLTFPPQVSLLLPLIFPLLGTVGLMLFTPKQNLLRVLQIVPGVLFFLSSILLFAQTVENEYLTTQIGNWEAPFGITFVADTFSAIILLSSACLGLLLSVYSMFEVERIKIRLGYFSLFYLLLASVSGTLLTGDIFNLYVWFEIMLISSFILMAAGGKKMQIEGTLKYVLLNLFGSLFFLIGIGLLYGLTGTLNLAGLSEAIAGLRDHNRVTFIAIFFVTGLGIKTAIFPLYFWLPGSYPYPPAPTVALIGGLLVKIGFYALFRIFTTAFYSISGQFKLLILFIAAFSMLVAVLSAIANSKIQKILSVHIVSQIGYLVLGLGLFSFASYAGMVFFLIHILLVKTNLFLISGIIIKKDGTHEIAKLGDGIKRYPFLAVLFLINALSLAGVPPLSGFWAKLLIIRSAFIESFNLLAMIALLTGLLTLISMTKIWKEVFWKALPEKLSPPRDSGNYQVLYFPVIVISMLVLTIGILPGPLMELAEKAAGQLSEPTGYIKAVLYQP